MPEQNIIQQIKQLEEKEKTASIEKSLLLKEALESNNAELIFKAQNYLQTIQKREKTEQKSIILDPYSINQQAGWLEKQYTVSYTILRNMSRIPVIKAIIETRVEQIVDFCEPQRDKHSTGFVIRPKRIKVNQEDKEKLKPEEEKEIEKIIEFLLHCGTNKNSWHGDDFVSFLRKFVTDCLTLDQGTFEIVRNRGGELDEIIATDGATYRLADKWSENNRELKEIKGYKPTYVQVHEGRILSDFYPWELCFGIRNAQSSIYSNGYGRSELEDLINTITSILHADQYNANYFKVGSNPKGILKVSGNINVSRIEEFRAQWQAQMAGVQNCIHPDTLIWTKEFGGLEIENTARGKQEQDVTIWTGLKWERAKIYKTQKKKINITRLNNGLEIKTSPEHKFAIINNEGEFDWKEQKDLKTGEYVLVNRKSLDADIKLPTYNGKEINKEMIELLGWMIGDGYLSYKEWDRIERNGKSMIYLFFHYDKELDILQKYKNVLLSYGINVCEKESVLSDEKREKMIRKYKFKTVSRKHHSLQIIDKNFISFLIELGFQTSKQGKVIPEKIFTLSEEYRGAFLRGLFSADGNREGEYGARLSINHDNLRKQVRNLLLTLGVRTSNCEKGRSSIIGESKYILRFLTIKDREIFNNKISFLQNHKKPTKEIPSTIKKVPDSVLIKYCSLAKEKQQSLSCFSQREMHDIRMIISGREKGALNKLQKFLNKAEIKHPEFWNNYYFEQVKILQETEEEIEMYDVEVYDDTHAFVGDGIIIHNSHRMPIIEADKMDFITTQTSNKDMEYSKYYEFLIKLACACYKIDPSEIGFPMNGSSESKPMFEGSNAARLKFSKDKGLKPLLKFVQAKINKYIVEPLTEGKYEFYFDGLDSETAQEELENDIKKMGAGLMDLKTGMAKYGHKLNIDKDIILNPVFLQFKQMMSMGGDDSNQFMDEEEESTQENPFEKSMQESWNQLMNKE